MTIVAYISGHGFGHLAQIAPVLRLLARRFPDWSLYIRSSLSPEVISHRLNIPSYTLLPGVVDVGVVQHSAISEDWPDTGRQAAGFFHHRYFPIAYKRK